MWTDEDRTIALLWQAEQSFICSGCGHDTRETTDPDAAGGPGRLSKYKAHLLVCHACAAQEAAAQALSKEKDAEVHGARWRVETRR